MLLSGTTKQFEVTWNHEERSISIISGAAYTPVGGELEMAEDRYKDFTTTASRIFFNGRQVELNAYHIEESNFFRLREIAELVDFGVDWDNDTRTVIIFTSGRYGDTYIAEESCTDEPGDDYV